MAIAPGWNISTITGHADPVVGDVAFDSVRHRIWFTEPDYGVVRIDIGTNNFEIFRWPLVNGARYGSIGVLTDGGVFVGVENETRMLHLDADLNALPEFAIEKPLGVDAREGVAVVLANMGNGRAVVCLDEQGNRIWRRRIADGANANFFCGFAPIFCAQDHIIALVCQRSIDCYIIGYDGVIQDRRSLAMAPGSWNEDLLVRSPEQTCTPTGRRYLLDAAYCKKTKSMLFLYAPPSGDHDLVVVQWPIAGGLPNVYDMPLWASRIFSVNGRIAVFGGETYAGTKKLYTMTLDDLEAVPLETFSAISSNSKGGNTAPSIQDLFNAEPISGEFSSEEFRTDDVEPDYGAEAPVTDDPSILAANQKAYTPF